MQVLARILNSASLPPRHDFGPLVLSAKQRNLRSDPSECVSSDRILEAVRDRFEETHVHSYGGALLAYALDRAFYDGFVADRPEHELLLRVLCSLEATLVQSGELADEFAVIVAVKS